MSAQRPRRAVVQRLLAAPVAQADNPPLGVLPTEVVNAADRWLVGDP